MTVLAHPLWRPGSACGPDCLPRADETPTVPVARRLLRATALLGMLGLGVGVAVLLPLLPAREWSALTPVWARATARACGVRLQVRGRLPRRRVLLVANHVSWWDVPALLAVAPARLVAKREVGRWPLVGLLARAAGTVFVDRTRPRRLPATVDRVAATLRAGRSVAVFPEGTTWCGTGVDCRPRTGFRPAMFQAAIDAGAPVVPLRIGYRLGATGTPTTAPAFLGEESLLRSMCRVLALRELTVTVEIAAPLYPAPSADRRALARVAESAVHLVPSSAAAPPAAPVPVRPVRTPPRHVVGPPPTGTPGPELPLAA
ncbi:lysophospholipid acyltransferase family protein [Micromonospora sp. NPDC049903]|uniref:lysophospholipid acyltransferase family protein n=1 Tax=Micromonospora sp. NPDC049903 TaxID=3364276 RepID=UPI00379F562A